MTTDTPALPQPEERRPSALALAAMIVGSVGILLPLLAPVAIVLAIIALVKFDPQKQTGKGRAITGLVCGFIGIAIGVVSVLILISGVNATKRAVGHNNLQAIGVGLVMYSNDNVGYFPPDLATLATGGYVKDADTFVRPGSGDVPAAPDGTPAQQWAGKIVPGSGFCSFTYVPKAPIRESRMFPPHEYVLAYETAPPSGEPVAVLFGDGHVERVSPDRWAKALARLQAGENPLKDWDAESMKSRD